MRIRIYFSLKEFMRNATKQNWNHFGAFCNHFANDKCQIWRGGSQEVATLSDIEGTPKVILSCVASNTAYCNAHWIRSAKNISENPDGQKLNN